MDGDDRRWLSPSEAARTLGLTPQRVKQIAAAGQLDCKHTALGRLIDSASLDRLVQERKANPPRRGRRDGR